eukprot:Lankesteria_metandrocarpae@DN1793_c0_g1_i1.p1
MAFTLIKFLRDLVLSKYRKNKGNVDGGGVGCAEMPMDFELVEQTRLLALGSQSLWFVVGVAVWWITMSVPRAVTPSVGYIHQLSQEVEALFQQNNKPPLLQAFLTKVNINASYDTHADSFATHMYRTLSAELTSTVWSLTDNAVDWNSYCSDTLTLNPDYMLKCSANALHDINNVQSNHILQKYNMDLNAVDNDNLTYNSSTSTPFLKIDNANSAVCDYYELFLLVDNHYYSLQPPPHATLTVSSHCTALLLVPYGMLSDTTNGFTAISAEVIHALTRTWLRSFVTPLSLAVTGDMVLQFWLVGDGQRRLTWNFHDDVYRPYLHNAVGYMSSVFDLSLESQVVLHSNIISLETEVSKARGQTTTSWLTAESLSKFLGISGQWMNHDVLSQKTQRPAPIRNFALYVPTNRTVLAVSQAGVEACSFSLPSWGTVAIGTADALQSPDELQRAAGFWISWLRWFLGLPVAINETDNTGMASDLLWDSSKLTAVKELYRHSVWEMHTSPGDKLIVLLEKPVDTGIARWEITGIARKSVEQFLLLGVKNIKSLMELLRELTDLVITPDLSRHVESCVSDLKASIKLIRRSGYDASGGQSVLLDAIPLARRAFMRSVEVLHDESAMGDTHFGYDMKLALYAPTTVPFIVPVLGALITAAITVYSRRRKLSPEKKDK